MPNTVVISVVATKGGVGKTTLAANTAGLLADLGFRVLAMDADMQPSLSKYYRLAKPPTTGMAEVISRGGLIQPSDIVPTAIPNLDIVVSNVNDATQAWLQTREDRLVLLKRAVRQPVVCDTYDFVVIDTQGAGGELQRSAAMAANLMLSPLCPRVMEYVEFQAGTLDMLKALNVMSDFSPDFRAPPLAVVINSMDRTRSGKMMADQIRNDFRGYTSIRLLDTVVPFTKAYPEARLVNLPVHRTDVPRKDRVAASGYQIMHELVFELAPWLKGLWTNGAVDVPKALLGNREADTAVSQVSETAVGNAA